MLLFFMVYKTGFGNFSSTLKGIFHHALDHYTSRNVIDVTAP